MTTQSIAGNIVGYAPNWAGNPTYIQYGKLTHIMFAFAECTTNGALNCDTTYLNSVITKGHAAGVKVLISVGGASNGDNMTKAMRNARLVLTTNIEHFVMTWGPRWRGHRLGSACEFVGRKFIQHAGANALHGFASAGKNDHGRA